MLLRIPLNTTSANAAAKADNYAGMTDGELQQLVRSAESLTALAWDSIAYMSPFLRVPCPFSAQYGVVTLVMRSEPMMEHSQEE